MHPLQFGIIFEDENTLTVFQIQSQWSDNLCFHMESGNVLFDLEVITAES